MPTRNILFGYAAFLVLCGFIAFAMSGFASNAMTALIVGCGTAVIIAICGALAGMIHTKKTAGMIGIHGGLIFAIVYAGLFGWRAFKAYSDPSKLYLAIILAVMALGSAIVFIVLLMNRPKPEARG